MPLALPEIDMLGVALVVVACLALLVTVGSRGRSSQSTDGQSGPDGEPSAVIPGDDYQGATDRRIRDLEIRLKTVESELLRINYELSKR
jgi:hypothetical protein